MNKITIILMITLFYLNVADSCTTLILLSTKEGVFEANPIMAFMFINGLMTAIVFKLLLSGAMLIAFYLILENVNKNHKEYIDKITIVANIALLASVVFLSITVANNIILIVR